MDALVRVEEALSKLRADLQDATAREQKQTEEAEYWKSRFETLADKLPSNGASDELEHKKKQRVTVRIAHSPKSSLLEEDSSILVFRRNASKLSEEYRNMQQLDTLDSSGSSMSFSDLEEEEENDNDDDEINLEDWRNIGTPACERKYSVDKDFTFSWKVKPSRALVIVKKTEESALEVALHTAVNFLSSQSIDAYLEPHLHERVKGSFPSLLQERRQKKQGSLMTWNKGQGSGQDACQVPVNIVSLVDFVVTLGGDGTVLWTSRVLGNMPTPPVVPFALGSLGFMTPFPYASIQKTLSTMIYKETKLMYRHRLQAHVIRKRADSGRSCSSAAPLEENDAVAESQHKFNILNELTIERGSSTFITNLDIYCNNSYVTNVQGDGLIISTPSGSTAYSMAAGGSICHPEVPCLLLTPICPHSLSCRPIIFPHQVKLSIQVPPEARNGVTCSFDGKDPVTLAHGDSIEVSMSAWPFRAVCNTDAVNDWLTSLRSELHYNKRINQKAC